MRTVYTWHTPVTHHHVIARIPLYLHIWRLPGIQFLNVKSGKIPLEWDPSSASKVGSRVKHLDFTTSLSFNSAFAHMYSINTILETMQPCTAYIVVLCCSTTFTSCVMCIYYEFLGKSLVIFTSCYNEKHLKFWRFSETLPLGWNFPLSGRRQDRMRVRNPFEKRFFGESWKCHLAVEVLWKSSGAFRGCEVDCLFNMFSVNVQHSDLQEPCFLCSTNWLRTMPWLACSRFEKLPFKGTTARRMVLLSRRIRPEQSSFDFRFPMR